MKDEFPGVNFAVVYFSDEDREEVAEIVRRRKWTMPVAHTPDGAVVNLYGVGGCPTTVFARAGGKVLESMLGPISEDGLRARGPAAPGGLTRARPRARAGLGRRRAGRGVPGARRLATRRGRAARAARPSTCASACSGWPAASPGARDPHAPGPRAVGLPRLLAPGGDRSGHRPHARSSSSRSTGSSGAGCPAATCWTTRSRSPRSRPACPVVAFDVERRSATRSACG